MELDDDYLGSALHSVNKRAIRLGAIRYSCPKCGADSKVQSLLFFPRWKCCQCGLNFRVEPLEIQS